jgi:hypothetical protein
MSNYQGVSYFANLMQQANKLKIDQEARNRSLVSNIPKTNKKTTKVGYTQTATKRTPFIEPEYIPQKETLPGIGALYKQAQEYNPFDTQKNQKELFKPLTYFNTLTTDTNLYIKGNQDKFKEQIQEVENKRLLEIEEYNKKNLNPVSNIFGFRNFVNKKQKDIASINKKYSEQKLSLMGQRGRFNEIASNVISGQTKTLNELKKYYGENFENISKEQLAVADLSSFQSLTGDIAKYESLRDSYIKKYQQSGSKVDMDWVKQYNDLLNDTAKSISSELPKIFTTASKTVESIKQTQQSSIAALEQLNKAFGKKPLYTSSIEKPAIDTQITDTRQRVIARQQKISSFGEQASKPSPKFTPRPL